MVMNIRELIGSIILNAIIMRRIGNGDILLQIGIILNGLFFSGAEVIGHCLAPRLVDIFLGLFVIGHWIDLGTLLYFLGIDRDRHLIVAVRLKFSETNVVGITALPCNVVRTDNGVFTSLVFIFPQNDLSFCIRSEDKRAGGFGLKIGRVAAVVLLQSRQLGGINYTERFLQRCRGVEAGT